MEYVVTLAVTITELDPVNDAQKTVLRKVSTVHHRGLKSAKEAYDFFVSGIRGCLYTEEDSTETTRRHNGEPMGEV